MKKHILIALLALCSAHLAAQDLAKDSLAKDSLAVAEKEEVKKPLVIINPAGKFYMGAEVGVNDSKTLESGLLLLDSKKIGSQFSGLQFGFMAEYYIARHWSLLAKLKYYQSDLSSYNLNVATINIISLPIAAKWEFRVQDNFAGGIKLGLSFSKDLNVKTADNLALDILAKPGVETTGFAGLGLNYFIDKNLAAYLDYDIIWGTTRASINRLFGGSIYVNNHHFSLGLKKTF